MQHNILCPVVMAAANTAMYTNLSYLACGPLYPIVSADKASSSLPEELEDPDWSTLQSAGCSFGDNIHPTQEGLIAKNVSSDSSLLSVSVKLHSVQR